LLETEVTRVSCDPGESSSSEAGEEKHVRIAAGPSRTSLPQLLKELDSKPGQRPLVPDLLEVMGEQQEADAGHKLTISGGSYQLVSSILDANILALPIAFKWTGVALGCILLLGVGMMSRVTMDFLLTASARTGKTSIDDLGLHLYGPGMAIFVQWCIILLNTGICAGNFVVVLELVSPTIQQLTGAQVSSTLIACVLAYAVVFPLCCLRNLASLEKTSVVAFVMALYMAVVVAFKSVQSWSTADHCEPEMFVFSQSIFQATPLFSFAYVCHFNVLPVFEVLHSRNMKRMRMVLARSTVLCTTVYLLLGPFGYARFCGNTPDNILAFPSAGQSTFESGDIPIIIARISMTLMILLALPMDVFPTRVALHSFLLQMSAYRSGTQVPVEQGSMHQRSAMTSVMLSVNMQSVMQSTVGGPGQISMFAIVAEGFGIVTAALVFAIAVPSISFVFGIVGAVFASLIVFIIPGMFYLRSTAAAKNHTAHPHADSAYHQTHHGDDWRQRASVIGHDVALLGFRVHPTTVVRVKRGAAYVVVLAGVVFGVLGTYSTIAFGA